MIPNDWKEIRLSETIALLQSGKSVNGEARTRNEGEVGILKVSAVTYGFFDPTAYKTVAKSYDVERLNVSPTKDTIIVSRANTLDLVGACAYINESYPLLFLPDKLWKLTLKESFSAKWLNYVLSSQKLRAQISNRATGTSGSMKNISQDAFLSILLFAPPLAEQRKIAEILGTWDEAIAQVAQLIAVLQQRKKGLMQRLLTGQVRFPGFEKRQKTQKFRLGSLPADWDIVQFEDIANINAKSLDNKINCEKTFHYIDLSAINRGKINFPIVTIPFSELPSRARRVLKNSDVIMSTVRPNLLAYAVCDFEPEDVLCSTGFALISPKNKADSQFIYQNLYSDLIQRQIHGLVTGSNYPAINSSEVSKLILAWPKEDEERWRIANILQACDDEIQLYQQQRVALQQQKKGLMQRLLTGQIRVTPNTT